MSEQRRGSDHETLASIRAQLLEPRDRADAIPNSAGVYAFHLAAPEALPGVGIGPCGVVYLGMTDSSLKVRDHFGHRHSGFSTLRRTLGAVLTTSLLLQAIPRGDGRSPSNVQHYRFRDEDESRLTDWMTAHLTFGFALVVDNTRMVERALIVDLCPPLNLVGWPNPQGKHLRALRSTCWEEARRVAELVKRHS
jgi:hypothetical protein